MARADSHMGSSAASSSKRTGRPNSDGYQGRPATSGIERRELWANNRCGTLPAELWREDRARTRRKDAHMYSPEPLKVSVPGGLIEARVLPGGTGTWWEQTALRGAVRRDRPDIFFAPAYTAPVGIGVPLAVTIHDISFIAHPEWFRPRERLRRRLLTTHAPARRV